MKPNPTKPRPSAPHPSAANLPRIQAFGAHALCWLRTQTMGGTIEHHARQLFASNPILHQAAVSGIVSDAAPGDETVGNPRSTQMLAAIEAAAALPLIGQPLPAHVIVARSDLDCEDDEASYIELEGTPIPVVGLPGEPFQLVPRPVAAIAVFSRELLKRPGAESHIGRRLLRAATRGWNAAAFSTSASYSLLDGAIEVPSSGNDAEAVLLDVQTALGSLTGTLAGVHFACSPRVAAFLALLRDTAGAAAFAGVTVKGGTLCGFPLIAQPGVPDVLIAIDGASALWTATEPQLAMAQNGTLELSSTPAGEIRTPAAMALARVPVNLYTTDSVAVRILLPAAWDLLRDSGNVAYISGSPVATAAVSLIREPANMKHNNQSGAGISGPAFRVSLGPTDPEERYWVAERIREEQAAAMRELGKANHSEALLRNPHTGHQERQRRIMALTARAYATRAATCVARSIVLLSASDSYYGADMRELHANLMRQHAGPDGIWRTSITNHRASLPPNVVQEATQRLAAASVPPARLNAACDRLEAEADECQRAASALTRGDALELTPDWRARAHDLEQELPALSEQAPYSEAHAALADRARAELRATKALIAAQAAP